MPNVLLQSNVQIYLFIFNLASGLQVLPLPTVVSSYTVANQLLIAQLSFTMRPSITVPISGFLKLTFPPQFQINASPTCQIKNQILGILVTLTNCTVNNQVVTLQLPSPPNAYAFDILLQPIQYFNLLNMIYTPPLNGTYFIDVTSYDIDGVSVLDSYSQFLVIDANPLVLFTVKSIPYVMGADAILDISFINYITIPSGQVQNRASDIQGFIELHFVSAWASDLGTGNSDGALIPCYGVNGLVPAQGQTIQCVLKLGTATTPPIIVITNFRQISANSNVRLLISGITNPSVLSYNILLKLFSQQNRIYTMLNTLTAVGTLTAAGATNTACTNVPQYSESRVGFLFAMTIQPCFTTNVVAGTYLLIQLPFYDTGFVQLQNTITCQIDSVDVYCIPLSGSDFIFIVSPPYTMLVSSFPSIVVQNLQWPRYVEQFSLNGYQLIVQVIDPNTRAQLQLITLSVLGANANPAGFDQIISVVPKKGNGFVDSSYSFTFYPQAQIPAGSIIVLQFPNIYNLLTGNKPPTFQQTGLKDLDAFNKVSIIVNLVLIKITNFQVNPVGNPFTLTAYGITNPNYLQSVGWTISATLQDNLILYQANFFSFYFTTSFKSGLIVFNQITASNLNADEQANYNVSFTPQTDIPIGGLIEITFPQNYKILPLIPDCRAYGGLSTFGSFQLTGNVYQIITNSKYSVGNGVITFVLRNIVNPDQGQTDGFLVQTSFGGIYLDLTDNSTTNGRTFTSQSKTLRITVNLVSFNPMNEGEEAAYFFSFITQSVLDQFKEIVFLFPIQYDSLLGRSIQCIVSSGLVGGNYICLVSSDRAVHLSGFQSYSPDPLNPINVTIYGIVNPNANNNALTDYIKIMTQPKGSNVYIESNSQAAQLTFFSAPGWSPLYTINVSTQAVRLTGMYNYTFMTNSNIPKLASQGAILFDFPKQFQVPDGIVPCQTAPNFAQVPTCTFYRNRATLQGNFVDFVGLLYVLVASVQNPIDQGSSDYFYVRTYDGLNLQIIERNFANLDPFTFQYYYPGPLIEVNHDQIIIVRAGTQMINIPVSVQYPSVLNLQLSPSTQPIFTLNPPIIHLPLGITLTYVMISVPETTQTGDYTIRWQLSGELSPLLYTPVKSTVVRITRTLSTQLIQTPILDIPLLGWSLLTEYVLQAAPDIQVYYELSLIQFYKGIRLDRSQITFNAGQSVSGFSVIYDQNVTGNGVQVERGNVSITAGGTNQYVYLLLQPSIIFNIIAQDTQAPSWLMIAIGTILKTSVQLIVDVDEPIMVYYLVALKGTLLPTLLQMQNQTILYPSTQSQYGYLVALVPQQPYTITISNLTAETDYVIHVYGLDRGFNQAPITSLQFTTNTRPNACDFTLKFRRATLDHNYIESVEEGVAFILGLPVQYIQPKSYYFEVDELDGRRFLQNTFLTFVDEVASYLDLYLVSDPYSENFPSPYDVVQQFQNKTQLFQARLPDIDLALDPVSVIFKRYLPQFVVRPSILFIDFKYCALEVQLNNYGFVYMIAVVFESHNQTTPSPYQISRGLDYQNRLTPFGQIEISQAYQDFIVVVKNLQPETDYFIYCIGGSVHPGQPDLMGSDQMYIDRIISFKAPPAAQLNINSGHILWGLFVIIIMIIY